MDQSKAAASEQLNLPAGFRFHPTDEELVVHYLAKKAESRPFPIPIVAEVDLYKFDPWELPEKAYFGEKEWYFFSPRDRKYPNGARPNRAAGSGYWKATGTDKPVQSRAYNSHKVGVKKALVFYTGKAPKGIKTNWIMHEYRLADPAKPIAKKKGSLRLDDWVLCRIYKKSSSAFKVMVAAPCKPEPAEKELDDVLASLPDIDDHENRLPQFMNNPSFISNTGPMMEELFHEHDAKSLSSHMDNDYRVLLNNSAATPNSDFDAMMLKSFNNWTSDPQHNSTISSPTLLMLPNQQHMQMHMNGGGRMKRARIEDEDDVQSTCRSPIPRFQQQGFGMADYSSQMQRLL